MLTIIVKTIVNTNTSTFQTTFFITYCSEIAGFCLLMQ